MRPMVRAVLSGAAAAVLVAGLAFGLTRDPRELPAVSVGRSMPTFVLEDLAGKRFQSDRLRGKPAVINFWASWCTECRKEHPLLMDAHDRWGDRVAFLGIVYQDTPDNIRDFLTEMGVTPAITYPNLMDPDTRTAIDFGVYGVPETFFVDRTGRVTFKRVGPITAPLLERELLRVAR